MRTLADAEQEAEYIVAQLRRSGNPEHRSVYIMDECDCLEQGGVAVPYHVHAFTEEQYRNWRPIHEKGPIRVYRV